MLFRSELHKNALETLTDNGRLYEQNINEKFDINKNLHVKNLGSLNANYLTLIPVYLDKDRIELATLCDEFCRSICTVQDYYAKMFEKHSNPSLSALAAGSYFGLQRVSFGYIPAIDYNQTFGNDLLKHIASENAVDYRHADYSFVQKIDAGMKFASDRLSSMINCSFANKYAISALGAWTEPTCVCRAPVFA